jgi:hypothetical protein
MEAIGYIVVHSNRTQVAALPIGKTRADGEALLRVFQLQYERLGKTAEVMELNSPLKMQLVESLRIEEVPSE